MAEWLTRRPAKPVTFGRASSNLVRREFFFYANLSCEESQLDLRTCVLTIVFAGQLLL